MSVEDGWRPFAANLLRAFPGLPESAAESLAYAQFQWTALKNQCRPESVVHMVARGVEIVLQEGLVKVLKSNGVSVEDNNSAFIAIGAVVRSLKTAQARQVCVFVAPGVDRQSNTIGLSK